MPRRRRQRGNGRKRTVRVHMTFNPWKERVPRGRRYLHMRVLPTFFFDVGVGIGGAGAIVCLAMYASGEAMTPLAGQLVFWMGLACGLYLTYTEILARPDRVLW